MKKLAAFIFAALFAAVSFAHQYEATVDGVTWYYNLVDDGNGGYNAEITYGESTIYVFEYSGSLTIPSTLGGYKVTMVGSRTFYNCSSLTSVTIPDSVTTIGSYAFYNCSSLKEVHITDLAKWCAISFGSADANPCYYAHHLYLNGEEIMDLVIPDSVTTISSYAFYNCSSLKSVTIPDSVATIGSYAFYGCSSLAAVVIPEGVSTIGEYAFEGCGSITSVTIPDSVTTIERRAFRDCSSLKEVHITDLAKWCAITFGSDDANPCYNAHHLYLNGEEITDLVIPDGVTTISSSAFYNCSSLTSVTIPDSVMTIGSYAFYNCSSLPSVTIPNGVMTIGSRAFSGCRSLMSVTIPDSVTTIGSYALSNTPFYNNLPDGFVILGNRILYAYKGACPSSITIPDGVTTIASYAFYNCSSLTSVTIPDSVTSIGSYAFYNCSSLGEVHITDVAKWCVISFGSDDANPCYNAHHLYLNGEEITDLVIPDGVTTISSSAFLNCSSLTSVTIPDSVTSIGSSAFDGCSSLGEVHITDVAKWCVISFGSDDANPCYNAHHLYLNGEEITDLVIPDGVTTIGAYAFDGCSSLTSVTIPDSVTSIGSRAFYGCGSLKEVHITDLAKWCAISFGSDDANPCYYAHHLYLNGEEIKDLDIPDGVTTIDRYAFYGCSSLTSVTIPDSVTSIGSRAFYGCSSLKKVHITDLAKWCAISFGSFDTNPCCYAHRLYLNGEEIKDLVIPDGVTTIGSCAFRGCSSLASVTIPKGVTTIGAWAFDDCSSLTSVTIPEGVTTIGSNAFALCSSLTSVVIPEGVSTIGEHAFGGCSSLTSVMIPDSVTTISSSMFMNCSSLMSITIPDSVTTIGEWAFYGCSSLAAIVIPEGVSTIGDYAFDGCRSLTSVTIPTSLTRVDINAFGSCENLNAVYISDLAKWCNIWFSTLNSNPCYYTPHLYLNGEKITNLVIPEGVTIIGSEAFLGCSSLTSVTIPSSVKVILVNAFKGCSSLKTVYVDEGDVERVKKIMRGTDVDVDTLTFVERFPDGGPYKEMVDGVEYTFSISNGEATIGTGDFYSSAISTSISGELVVPSKLGGCPVKMIGVCAFYNCDSLTSVTIPDSVTTIGEWAFRDCSSLTSVTIPDSVTEIGGYAFDGTPFYNNQPNGLVVLGSVLYKYKGTCPSFVTIPDSVTSIGAYAFEDCDSLTSVTIPDSVTTIGLSAFDGCSSLKEVHTTDVAKWCAISFGSSNANPCYYAHHLYLNGEEIRDLVIPDSVTSIGAYAFEDCDSLTTVTIPDSVTTIGEWAFRDCSSLTSVTIPDSVTEIGGYAFDGTPFYNNQPNGLVVLGSVLYKYKGTCPSFVTIPDSVTTIGEHAFEDCDSLTSVTIPDGVTTIGAYAFSGCSSLTSVTIPDSVMTIWDGAFEYCSSLTSITIPSSVTAIRYHTFYKCTSLTSVTIPDSVTTIENRAFRGCESLTSVTIPDSVTEIGESAFERCSLTTVTIPDSVTEIGESAFEDCSSLMSVTFGNGVKTIGLFAFSGCESLTSVTIPDSVTEIGESAFGVCSSLTSVTIGNGATSIGESAFWECSSLASITIPNSVTEIGDFAFSECDALTTVYVDDGDTARVKELMRDKGVDVDTLTFVERLPDGTVRFPDGGPYTETIDGIEYTFSISNGEATIGTGSTTAAISTETEGALYVPSKLGGCPVATIGSYAFAFCREITAVIIPDGVTTIGGWAFEYCRSLDSIVIPDSVTTIGNGAFLYCSSLASVTIPNSVTTIGSDAFSDCQSLESITIPNSVTTIEINTFARCSSLTSITIPPSVTKIDTGTFLYCNKLENVYISDLTKWCEIWFGGTRSNPCVYAHNLVLNGEKITDLVVPAGLTTIAESAFCGYAALTSVTIPDSVTRIGWHAFADCSSLKSVKIPNSVTMIEPTVFDGCSSLTSVTIPDGVTTIQNYTFRKCSSLASMTIPGSVATIGKSAFADCSSLTTVTIPDSVMEIGESAFMECDALTTVYVDYGDTERVKELMRGTGVDVDTLTFVEINVDLPEATYSHDFNGGMTTPSSILGGVIIPNRGDTFGSFTHVIREGEPNGAGAVPSTAGGKNGQYGSTELVDDEADWTIAMVAKAANVANGTFWSVGADCWSDGKTGMALVLKDSTHVSLVRWQKGGNGNETLLMAEVPGATEAFHLYTVSYNHETETYTLFVDTTEAASFTGARTFITNGYQIGSVHGGSGNVNLATANGFVFDDFAVWKGFAAQVKHARKIAKMYTPVVAVGSYTFDWPEGETAWRNDIGFAVGSASGITPCAGDTIRFATGETITFPSGATIPSGIELIIDSGTIKLSSGTPSKVTVNAGATLDVAGTPDRNFAIVLNGGTLTNSGNNIGSGYMQTPTIELTADSFIDSSRDFGSIASGYQGHSFNLNGHKLTKRGTGVFYIANATFTSGSIDIEAGSVELMKGYTIPSGATLGLTGSQNGELSVLQVGTQTGAINLTDNLTVKLKITSIPDFVKNATGWTGKLVIAANISGLASIGANMALYGNASEIEIASGASCSGYFPNSARTSKLTINGTFTVNDGYSGENKAATVSELAGSGTIVDGIAANNKGATPIVKVEKYDDWNGTIQEATTKKLTIEFLAPTVPTIEGDDAAEVTGDAETGFVVKPSEETTDVVITIPEGVDAEKVTIEVSTAVQSVKANGATIKVVNGEADITEFLDIPAAVDGVVNLGAAVVKEEIVKEALDTEKGAVIELSAEDPTLTTAETKPGLTYTLIEGATLESMGAGASKLGDGTAWTPEITVKGGKSGFYTIKVTK